MGGSFTLVNEDEVLVGSVIGERYHVKEVLGQGSTGTVFGADHLQFPRAFAVKVLRPRYVPLEVVHRVFLGEARAAWSVQHPCLCEVFDLGQLPDGAPFYVTERLEGETLARRIRRERLSLASAVDVLMQILSATMTIHARELLWRDLRPHNIFLSHRRGCRPVVKLLDFGLSRLVPLEKVQEEWDARRGEVAEDSLGALAIPYYLSPERARGERGVEPASDLFIAALIFYEALTGARPFSATSFNGLLLQISQASPTPLGELRSDIPVDLDDLVMRALSPNPRARPASAREFQDELRAIFDSARRGSASMRAAAPESVSLPVTTTAPETDSIAHTPQRVHDASRDSSPSVTLTRDSARELDDLKTDPRSKRLYEEDTRANRRLDELTGGSGGSSGSDEASAESPLRTMRPPSAIDIVFEEDLGPSHDDPPTSRGREVETAMTALLKQQGRSEDEETATMELTPELRARIDSMTTTRQKKR